MVIDQRRIRGSALVAIPLAGALVLALSGAARAGTSPQRSGAAAHRPPVTRATLQASGVGRAGMVLDLGPTRATTDAGLEAARDPSLTRATDGLVLEVRADGSRHVDLRGRFRSYAAVSLAADGTLRIGCADDPANALELARAAAGPPTVARAGFRLTPFGPEEE
jgi:hypothetical protein